MPVMGGALAYVWPSAYSRERSGEVGARRNNEMLADAQAHGGLTDKLRWTLAKWAIWRYILTVRERGGLEPVVLPSLDVYG
jgi:hypothetical protein